MGRRAKAVQYVCRACGAERWTRRTGKLPQFCNRQCRADYERRGEANPCRYIQKGYWMLRWNVRGGTRRKPRYVHIFEHRYVWQQANGPIPEGYIVHHINGDKQDNRLENLSLMWRGDHVALHHEWGDYPQSREMAEQPHTRRAGGGDAGRAERGERR